MSGAGVALFGTPLYRAATPLLVLLILAMMVLPLPPFVLDLLFTLNLALAMIVLLVALNARRPLDFSVFPTVLLLTTLLRLSLNVASTRLILLEGHTGPDAAGQVIESFGNFLVGGNAAVGFVVFLILVVINFVVITKGAGRIAEVAARFTLDSMPGKQLAVDADLNAGFIDEKAARARRADIAREADFYGAMDGASKFVRGDAVAGIVILLVNLVGGVAIGLMQHDMSFSPALARYALLTVGDGLVTQIPALVISTAAGIVVSRASAEQDLSREFVGQVLGQPRLLLVAAVVLGVLGMLPGTPHLAFLGIAALISLAVWWQLRQARTQVIESEPEPETATHAVSPGVTVLDWNALPRVEALALEVGYRLIPLIDPAQGGAVLERISEARRARAYQTGVIPPAVQVRDQLDLKPHAYRLLLRGAPLLAGELRTERILAVDAGEVFGRLEGDAGSDPLDGAPGVWLDASRREHAQLRGYRVLDAADVLVRTVEAVFRKHAAELFGRSEALAMLDALAVTQPELVATLRERLSLETIQAVLRELLTDQVPLRDSLSLFEALVACAATSQTQTDLVSAARVALARQMIEQCAGSTDPVEALGLAPDIEARLLDDLRERGGFAPDSQAKLTAAMHEALAGQARHAQLLFVTPALRRTLAQKLGTLFDGLTVLSYAELPADRRMQINRLVEWRA